MFWVLELIKPLTVYCFGNGRWSFFSQPEIIQSPTPWTSWALCSCDEATRYLRHCWERKLPQNLCSCAEGTVLVEKTSVQQGNILWRTFTGHQLSAEMFRYNTDEFQGNSIWHRNQNKIVTVVFCVICHSFAQKDNKSVVHVIAEEGCRTKPWNCYVYIKFPQTCNLSSDVWSAFLFQWLLFDPKVDLRHFPTQSWDFTLWFCLPIPSADVAKLENPKWDSSLQTNSPTGHFLMSNVQRLLDLNS